MQTNKQCNKSYFSNSKYLGIEKDIFFVGNDDNHIKMIDKDAILDFLQDKNQLYLKHLQTPLLKLDFGNSFEYTSDIVFKSASLQQQAGNDYLQDFDCSGLPLGEYILYIHVNGNTFTEKVSIK